MKAIVGIAIALLVGTVLSAWTEPKEIKGDGTHIKHFSSYLDKVTLKTHIAYCTETTTPEGITTQGLMYVCLGPKNDIIIEQYIGIASGCRAAQITAAGKSLVIAFEGQRQFHLGVCNATNTKGCFDVYVTESKEEGYNWGNAVPVPRKSLSDVADRTAPHLLVNPDTSRIYVFYLQRNIGASSTNIAYVTRPKGSLIFSNEVVTRFMAEDRFIGTLTTINEAKVVIHLFAENKGRTTHIYTENSITWYENTITTEDLHFSSFVADYQLLATVIMGICTDGKSTLVLASTDHGKTWPQKFSMLDNYHRVSFGMLCLSSDKKLKMNAITTNFMQTGQTYFTASIPDGEKKVLDAPFKGLENYGVFMPQVMCYTSQTTKMPAAKALAYVWTKPNKPRIYVTDNEEI